MDITMELRWHNYRYYPYERNLALREIQALLSPGNLSTTKHGIRLTGCFTAAAAERLTYFAEIQDGVRSTHTMQALLERVNGNGTHRQSTRYSAHGLHEYKGKFNPQIVRAILNLLNIPVGSRVLDPFCGSGTSLIECGHLGMFATGTDINPLAVFIANAKIAALQLSAALLHKEVATVIKRCKSSRPSGKHENNVRIKYLKNWFEASILDQIERLRVIIEQGNQQYSPVLLSIASNLLRDYSLQDPHDLRIRRRKSPLPTVPFIEAYNKAAVIFLSRLADAQLVLATAPTQGKALLINSRNMRLRREGLGSAKFDCALTSPPYATALPYIDTQRLSLVWLGLLPPSELLRLDACLIGSREVRGEPKKDLLLALLKNRSGLPKAQAEYCCMLQAALSSDDGFRRQALPLLLYRYFASMAESFSAVKACMKKNAPFALIVGRNHSVLSGKRFDIDTPHHLAQLACANGWSHEETIPLQTYHRYGYHMSNAVNSECLVLLRAQ